MGFSINENNGNLEIKNIYPLSLDQTLDCGQAFRWTKGCDGIWRAVAHGRTVELKQYKNNITIFNMSENEFNKTWREYFDIDRDYGSIIEKISVNPVLKTAAEFAGGIRILKQEPWETLCSFIISQNNNIPRIKGIIERLCKKFGNRTNGGYTFPDAEILAKCTVEDLAELRCGFRARYIIDAAQKTANGEIDIEKLYSCDIDEARAELMKICGVGLKVADCTLLFGFGRIEAFPKDVWIKKALEKLFGGEIPKEAENFGGIVQQYIFYYARETKLEL